MTVPRNHVKPGRMASLYRNAVLRQLSKLKHGVLKIQDPWGEVRIGEGRAGLFPVFVLQQARPAWNEASDAVPASGRNWSNRLPLTGGPPSCQWFPGKNQRSWNSWMVIAYSPLSFFSTFPFSSRFTSTTARTSAFTFSISVTR